MNTRLSLLEHMYRLLSLFAASVLPAFLLLTAVPRLHAAAAVPLDRPPAQALWPHGAPGARGNEPADIPTITVYSPPPGRSNRAAVVICPGGAYGVLSDSEGDPVARWLNTLGVTGIVLQYRLGPRYHHPAMLQDAARAMRTVRSHAADWHIDPARVGILGFSAGGHLASTLATHFDPGQPNAADPVERQSSRPDVAILIYPVITMQIPYTHQGSRTNLLGEHPAPELIDELSNETQVTAQTPPTFLVSTAADTVVPCENSLMFAAALHRAGVPFSLHIYEQGQHGFGLGGNDPILSTWPATCAAWLRQRGFLQDTVDRPSQP